MTTERSGPAEPVPVRKVSAWLRTVGGRWDADSGRAACMEFLLWVRARVSWPPDASVDGPYGRCPLLPLVGLMGDVTRLPGRASDRSPMLGDRVVRSEPDAAMVVPPAAPSSSINRNSVTSGLAGAGITVTGRRSVSTVGRIRSRSLSACVAAKSSSRPRRSHRVEPAA